MSTPTKAQRERTGDVLAQYGASVGYRLFELIAQALADERDLALEEAARGLTSPGEKDLGLPRVR